jgi:hypothetical protein
MDKHTPVRIAFVNDYLGAKKAYEQARTPHSPYKTSKS